MAKSWAEKLAGGKTPHIEILTKKFGGMAVGDRMLILDPKTLKAEIDKLPFGTRTDMACLRAQIAKAAGVHGCCPISTGIFARIVAEAALDEHRAGRPLSQISPFWRAIDPASPLAQKLTCGPDFVTQMRELEAVEEVKTG